MDFHLHSGNSVGRHRQRGRWILAACIVAIAAFFLWPRHQQHMLDALPYLLLLACPLMHMLHHRHRHQHGERHASPEADDAPAQEKENRHG